MSEPTPRPAPSPRLPWPILVGLALALIAATGLVMTMRRATSQAAPPAGTAAAPAFRLASLDGRQLGPNDFPGQVVLLDFWATWCVPCHLQAEVLAEVYAKRQGQPVQFLAVSVGEDEATVREYLSQHAPAYPVLFDPASKAADSYEVVALPTVILIDRQGRVVLRESGLVDAATLERAIAKALAG